MADDAMRKILRADPELADFWVEMWWELDEYERGTGPMAGLASTSEPRRARLGDTRAAFSSDGTGWADGASSPVPFALVTFKDEIDRDVAEALFVPWVDYAARHAAKPPWWRRARAMAERAVLRVVVFPLRLVADLVALVWVLVRLGVTGIRLGDVREHGPGGLVK